MFMTHLWHVSDIFLTRFQNISSNRFWFDSDKCRFSDTFMTRFRHHYDTFMPRLWHLYDTFLTSAILKRKWMKFNSNKKKVGDAAVAFRLFRIAEVLHFRFPLPVSTSGFHFRFPLPVVVFIADLPVDRQALYCLCPKTLLGEQNSICILEKKAANLLSAIFLSFPSGFRLPVSGFRLPALAKLVNFCSFWYSSIKILEFDK